MSKRSNKPQRMVDPVKVEKKVYVSGPVSSESEIASAYELFDKNGGRIDPYELKTAMQALGYDTKNPSIYSLVADMDNSVAEKNGGVTFAECAAAINAKIGDNDSKDNLKRIFNLLADPNTDTITIETCKNVARITDAGMTDDEATEMMKKACKGNLEMTFDEFVDIMSKSGK